MSILDRLNLFSNDQAITASTASTDVVDLGSVRDVSAGETSTVLVLVTEAFNNLTDLTVAMQTSTTENFASPVQLTAATLPLASLTVSTRFPITTVPRGVLRYVRLYYTVTGTAPTTGRITAGLGTKTVQDPAIYPAGV
jgi:mRNA-degrading endonuclease toxin of MazEF toxin-antitoxin module